ncbi:MAG: DNA repair exonuclease [Clostridia bacterium]|nr:DNA repair exonuclease [Clostridia bacterium]
MRILHTGDLHFASPARAFSPRAARAREERGLAAFEQLLATAAREGAELLLLAGDCFDSPTPDADTVRRFYRALAACGMPAVIAPGNHDYYRAGGFWDAITPPENVYLFRESTLSYFDFPSLNLTVYGYAFTAEHMDAPALPRASELVGARTGVLLAHADLLSPLSPYAPLSAGALATSGLAYAALGHIHKPPEPRLCGKTLAAYCGFFAGRGFDETGAGGALLVEIEGETVRQTRLLSTADRFEICTVDCTGSRSAVEVRARVADALKAKQYPIETALRVMLTGSVGLACHPDTATLETLGAQYALFEVADATLPIFDAAYLEKDPTLYGAFYRALLPRLQSADEQTRTVAAAALRLGLSALSGKEV